jgi:antitoxin (DNA-binding transcriptional repressor) of toxin-antitoxin stability system
VISVQGASGPPRRTRGLLRKGWEARPGAGLDLRDQVGYFGLMKTATLTKAKNRLGALIDQIRHGETILILDQGRAVARLTSVLAEESSAPKGRVERLERQGILHRAQAPKSPQLFQRPRPVPREAPAFWRRFSRSGGAAGDSWPTATRAGSVVSSKTRDDALYPGDDFAGD